MILRSLAVALALISPIDGTSSTELDRAATVLDLDLDGDKIVEAAVGLLVVGAATTVLPLAVGWYRLAVAVLSFSGVVAAGVLLLPEWLATARQTRALGDLPDLIGFAVLRMQVDPTPERAADFAATHTTGPLADSLREQIRRAHGTPHTGWSAFGSAWNDDAPSLPRAVALLTAAGAAPPADRDRLLSDALDHVLRGTRDRMAAFAASLHGPTTGLYAFGVVLPLATIGALPTLRAAGIPVRVEHLAIGYDVMLPVAVAGAGAWIVGRRPAAFPPVPVGGDHPDLPDRRRRLLVVVPVVGGVTFLVTQLVYPDWSPILVVPTVTGGVTLLVWTSPVTTIRANIRDTEAGLPAALTIVGQRLQQGTPPETAVGDAAATLDGRTGAVFEEASGVHDRIRVGIAAAFTGAHGALTDIPSPRLHASATLLALAGKEGPHGGEVLLDLADHLEDLRTVQRDARRELSTIVDTLRSTACCFAPLIGGATVALADRIDGAGLTRSVASIDTAPLALVVGVYVVVLGVVLAALAAALDRGLDRAVIGEQIGYALVCSGVVYPTAVVAGGWLV